MHFHGVNFSLRGYCQFTKGQIIQGWGTRQICHHDTSTTPTGPETQFIGLMAITSTTPTGQETPFIGLTAITSTTLTGPEMPYTGLTAITSTMPTGRETPFIGLTSTVDLCNQVLG